MDVFDLTKEHNKEPVKEGSILFIQGEMNKAINILHSGLVEILFNEDIKKGDTAVEIINGSLRVGLVKGESLLGIMGIMHRGTASSITIRTITECIISTRPMKAEDLISKIQSDMPFNLKVLRALITRVESTFYLFNNYKYLWHKFASIIDSIALGCNVSGRETDRSGITRMNSSIEEYSLYLKNKVTLEKIPIPDVWDYNIFLGRIQDKMNLYADHDELIIEDLIDHKQFLFIKRLIRKKDDLLTALFRMDEPTNQYIFEFLGRTLESMIKANKSLAKEIDDLITTLFADKGWIDRIVSENDTDKDQVRDFIHYMAKFCWRCRKDTINLLGKDLQVDFKIFSLLKNYKNITLSIQKGELDSVISKKESGNRLVKYKGLFRKILDFSDMSHEFKEEFTFLIEKIKKVKNKFSNDPEIEKLRMELTDKYWQLYEVCFLKIIDSDLKGFIPGIMLHFGVIDEELLTESELLLTQSSHTLQATDSK